MLKNENYSCRSSCLPLSVGLQLQGKQTGSQGCFPIVKMVEKYGGEAIYLNHLIKAFKMRGAPVAQRVKCWPTDLVVPSLSHSQGKIFTTVNRFPLHTAFNCHLPIVSYYD